MEFDDFKGRFPDALPSGNGYRAKCPAHDDRNPSLSFWLDEKGKIAYKCHAGCSHDAVLSALGLQERDLYTAAARAASGAAKSAHVAATRPGRSIVAEYDYFTKDGKPLVQVVRYDPKGFGRKSPDGKGGWKWGGTSKAVALYRWPQLAEAVAKGGRTVFLVEGEKDADNMIKAGAVATTCLGGASKWQPVLAKEFQGAGVVLVIADRDGERNHYEGQKFALAERRSIVAHGVKARAVCLPATINGKPVKDASDALTAGWTLADIERHCETADEVETEFPQIAEAAPAEAATATTATGTDAAQADTLKVAIETAVFDAGGNAAIGKSSLSREDVRKITAEAVVGWMRRHGHFYADEEAPDAGGPMWFEKSRKELFSLNSEHFSQWLSFHGGLERITPTFKTALDACRQEANFGEDSAKIRPSLFWDFKDGVCYISCGNGEMARIKADGAEIVDNGTDGVLFLKDATLPAWRLVPESEAVPLWRMRVIGDIHTPDNPLAPLRLLLWLLALPRNFKKKPILSLIGPQGSGKSRTAEGIHEILFGEVTMTALKKSDKGAEEFWVIVSQGGVSVFDNIDSKIEWLPDAASGASTGAINSTRALFTNNDVFKRKPNAAIILTSRNAVYAKDPGLADRLINISFTRRGKKGAETADGALTREIEANRDGCISWIAHTIAAALRVKESPPAGLNKRHPDWAAWAWRCGVALGWRHEAERALREAEADKSLNAVLSDQLRGAVWMRLFGELGYSWEGTTKELLEFMVKGGGEGCGHQYGSIVSIPIPQGAVSISEENEGLKDKLTPHSLGLFIRDNKPQLQEVFNLGERTLHGKPLYRFDPPPKPGEIDESGPFVKMLKNCFGGGTEKATETPAEIAETPQNRTGAGEAADTPATATDAPRTGRDRYGYGAPPSPEEIEIWRESHGYTGNWEPENDRPFVPPC